jgi:predicted glycoside hydrolase/deacetylase ChbG (UPF0249 family)
MRERASAFQEFAPRASRVSLLRVPTRAAGVWGRSSRVSAAQRLGYDADARVVIINADDFGLCEEANGATIEAFRRGALSSASVMVPAPGFAGAAEFARANPQADIGVHLVLTSEWTRGHRWGPVLGPAAVPSLVDEEGWLWPDAASVFARSDPREAEAELRAQIDLALAKGIDASHVDSHMFVLHGWHAAYRDIYLRIAHDYRVPLRGAGRALLMPIAWRSALSDCAMPLRAGRRALRLRNGFTALLRDAPSAATLMPDYVMVMGFASAQETGACWSAALERLPPGLTEIYCHPALPSAELLSYADDVGERAADFQFFGSPSARALLSAAEVKLIGYRTLREALRLGLNEPGGAPSTSLSRFN